MIYSVHNQLPVLLLCIMHNSEQQRAKLLCIDISHTKLESINFSRSTPDDSRVMRYLQGYYSMCHYMGDVFNLRLSGKVLLG